MGKDKKEVKARAEAVVPSAAQPASLGDFLKNAKPQALGSAVPVEAVVEDSEPDDSDAESESEDERLLALRIAEHDGYAEGAVDWVGRYVPQEDENDEEEEEDDSDSEAEPAPLPLPKRALGKQPLPRIDNAAPRAKHVAAPSQGAQNAPAQVAVAPKKASTALFAGAVAALPATDAVVVTTDAATTAAESVAALNVNAKRRRADASAATVAAAAEKAAVVISAPVRAAATEAPVAKRARSDGGGSQPAASNATAATVATAVADNDASVAPKRARPVAFVPERASACVFVGNLPLGATADSVQNALSAFGPLRVHLESNNSGRPAGFGYAEFSGPGASAAVAAAVAAAAGGAAVPAHLLLLGSQAEKRPLRLLPYTDDMNYRRPDGSRRKGAAGALGSGGDEPATGVAARRGGSSSRGGGRGRGGGGSSHHRGGRGGGGSIGWGGRDSGGGRRVPSGVRGRGGR